MRRESCRRWIRLVDREAVGGALLARERRYVAEHAVACDACGAERDMFSALRDEGLEESLAPSGDRAPDTTTASTDIQGGEEERFDNERIDEERAPGVVAPEPVALATPSSWRRQRWVRVGAVAAVAAVAAAAGWLAFWRAPPATQDLRMLLVSGDVRYQPKGGHAAAWHLASPGAREVTDGASIDTAEGRACVHLPGDVVLCVHPRSRARLELADPRHRVVVLERGAASATLPKQPVGVRFSIEADDATVTAVGTSFSVERSANGDPTRVRTFEGRVEVVRRGMPPVEVGALEELAVGDDRASPLAAPAGELELTLLRAGGLGRGGDASLRVLGGPSSGDLFLDGALVGSTPAWVLLPAGLHTVRIASPSGRDVEETIRFAVGQEVERRYGDLASAQPASSAPAVVPKASGSASTAAPDRDQPPIASAPAAAPSRGAAPIARAEPAGGATELLDQARGLRAAGRLGEARAVYQLLLHRHPASREAGAVQLSLAEVDLALGRPSESLAGYDAYLSRGGPLAIEASLGRIRALRSLGRLAEESAAIDAFIAAHPASMHAESLRARRQSIRDVHDETTRIDKSPPL